MDRKTRHKVRRASSRKRQTRKRRDLSELDMETFNTISHHNFTYYDGKIPPIKNGRLQCKTTYGVILQDGFRYPYKCEKIGKTTLRIDGGSKVPCFVLMLHPDHKTGHLQDIAKRMGCSLDPGATMKAAGKAAFQVAREYGVRQIELTDNSTKYLPSGKSFRLSVMKFLTTGQTWYESFLPIRPHPKIAKRFEQLRNIVRTNTWADVYACLLTNVPEIQIPVDISDIDSTLPGSAMTVLQRIKEANTDFFADYGDILCTCSRIETTYGTEWIADV